MMYQPLLQQERLAKIMLVCVACYALFGMHLYLPHLFGIGLQLPFNVAGWFFVGLMTAIGLWQWHRRRLLTSRFWLGVVVASAVLWLPFLYPHNNSVAGHALPRMLGLTGGLLFYLALQQCRFNGRGRRYLLYCLLLAVSVEILLGMVQFFLLEPGNRFGYNTEVRSPYGIFQHRNVMASFVVTGMVLAVYLWLNEAKSPWRPFLLKSAWFAAVLGAGAVLVVLLQSRAGQLGLLLGLGLMLPLVWQTLIKTRSKRLLASLALIPLGILAGVFGLEAFEMSKRSLNIYTQADGRFDIYAHGLRMWLDKPWFGHGYGGFESAFYQTYAQWREQNGAEALFTEMGHPHNEFLFWAIEGGLVPLLGLVLITVLVLRLLHRVPFAQALAWVGILTPIFIHSQTEFPFYHSLPHWFMVLVLIFVIDAEYGQRRLLPAPPAWSRWPVRAWGIGLMLFMASGLYAGQQLTRYAQHEGRAEAELKAVVNPLIWHDRVAFYRHHWQLKKALLASDRAQLLDYAGWARRFLTHTPRAGVYYNAYLALTAARAPEQAEQLLAEARRLYPNVQLLRPSSIKRARERLEQVSAEMLPAELNDFIPLYDNLRPAIGGAY
ncbi:PglL family O-oligosaccharyltransferase [Zobellella iuensis]|uniref:O-antigen ligase C-terminal domain-containing protein n=1 Tax=Zobellella iuensis TaxID=2803811 RepID=A0ABS1QNH8_9GAMM|nr:Wzy polymerase domain-containing protein [Zobellella iuensis]MBL1376421.1 O-antigen ligase C-terminal domain-containing protein [Zobellella iuensis]